MSRHLLYIAAAVGLTWPLALQMEDQLPLGTEGPGTVPLFNLWTLLWNADRLQHGYAGYWDAPIFYPESGTFALSEPQPLTGLVFALLTGLSRNPVAAYNGVLLLFLALNGIAADWLLRKLGVQSGPAMLGSLMAVALPFVGNELGVLQLTAVFPIFFALGSLWSFAQCPGWLAALGIGGWSAAAFLFCGYYGLFLTLFLLLGGVCLFNHPLLRRKIVLQLLVGLLLAGLFLLPVLPQQVRLTADYSRSSTIQRNSAEADEYLHLYRRTLGEQLLPWIAEDNGRQRLYPGTILLMLALIGMAAEWRGQLAKRWLLLAVLGIVLAFGLSLGLNLLVGEWRPYHLLMAYYPGFGQLRSPFRLAVFVQIFLVTLAGLGLNGLWQWGRPGRLLAVVLVVVGLAEVVAWPARLYTVPQTIFEAAWIDWLKDQPETGAVLMLPMSQGSSASDFEPIVIGMLQGLEHGRPLGNGYSGFFPASYRSLKGRMAHFPNPDTIQYLQESGFSFLVIDRAWWDEEKAEALSAWEGEVELVYEDGEKVIYRMRSGRFGRTTPLRIGRGSSPASSIISVTNSSWR